MRLEKKRPRVRVKELASFIPHFPPFAGEDSIDAGKEAAPFLTHFRDAVQAQDWQAFGDLFLAEGWWKDKLTLTFDLRQIHGRDAIVEAWKTLSSTRKPTGISSETDEDMALSPSFMRMSPTLATLDVPFRFYTEAPSSKCMGIAKLVREGEEWKIWILTTGVISLTDYPVGGLPRQNPTVIDVSQRGVAKPHGLPIVDGVLDAVVVGGSMAGISNTIMLEAMGANVATFDLEAAPGGNWATKRYENITLHHPQIMSQLPEFPPPKELNDYMTGLDIVAYFTQAVEQLQLPWFGGVRVANTAWDETSSLWNVRLEEVASGEETTIQARNVIISTGFIVGPGNPAIPELADKNLFKGSITHSSEVTTTQPYVGKNVLIVGSGNSAHDIANNTAQGGAASTTILQRSPTVLVDFETLYPLFSMNYQGQYPIYMADFVDTTFPLGIARDFARAAGTALLKSRPDRNAAFESKGYLVETDVCWMTKVYEERGRSFYMDQPGTFKLVFEDKIKIERGEAKGFVEDGVVVVDKETGEEKVVKTDAVILATGYEAFDLPGQYVESGFMEEETAKQLENVNLFGVDEEGEVPGLVTYSGHPHLFFSGLGFYHCRWISRFTAVQILADVSGNFPERYPRHFLG